MTQYLPTSCRILERPFMEFRPFGKEPTGETIRDLSGMSIRANVEYLEESICRVHGPEAGKRAVEELVTRLNERIPDHAYHVTAEFLKNPWTGYSNEFVAYLVELCMDLSGDQNFQFNMGRRKLISPIIQTLMRPFPIHHIYKMASSWVQHYNQNSYHLDTTVHDNQSAIVRMTLTERASQQFGPYRQACGKIWCNALKIGMMMVPSMVHRDPEASVHDLSCIAHGDNYCEWRLTWTKNQSMGWWRTTRERSARRILKKEIEAREQVIQEQMQSLESRHQELHSAYVDQQQYAMERQRRLDQLMMLHETGLTFISTRDQETLLKTSMETIIKNLPYNRVLLSFFDADRRVLHSSRIVGVTQDVEYFVRTLEIPVTDPPSIDGRVLLGGESLLIGDLREVWDDLHPLYQELAKRINSQGVISVPLKVKNRIIGSLSIDCMQSHVLTQDDLVILKTVGNQIAIALDNARAYEEIGHLNVSLEMKVKERTKELECANEKLQEMDRLKSQFLANVSHDLRTPLTAIKGLSTNLLDGLLGSLSESQATYLCRINTNAGRLTRMISDLLDLTSIAAGKIKLHWSEIDLTKLTKEMVEQVEFLAEAKALRLNFVCPETAFIIRADGDRLSQVILNLIDNAIKFTPHEGTIKIELRHEDHQTVTIVVSDTGPGIPEESLANLFDPFFQAPQQPQYGKKGLGLGLSIVKNFVDLHGGTLKVDSQLGQGTCFTVSIPVRQQPVLETVLKS